MTTTVPSLAERTREFIEHGADVDERLETLALRGRMPSADAQDEWIGFAASVPAPMVSLQIYDPDIGGDLTPGDSFDPDRRVIITIEKPAIAGVGLFFFQSSLAAYFLRRSLLSRLAIADLQAPQAFSARGLQILPWDLPGGPPGGPPEPVRIDPTPYVRDFVPEREVVTDLSPWILATGPAAVSPVFQAWQAISARRLLASLVSRAWLEDGHVWLQVSGPPIYKVRADDTSIPAMWEKLGEAADWVFLAGRDVEARHLIYANELARADRPNQGLAATLERTLEAAKVTYEAHVQSSSRETLKALADLRKTVIDETQKVAQRAQDLTSNLWRDLAVSAAPFVLKILGDTTKLAGPVISALFYFAAAGFVALSFILQWRINRAYFRSQTESRQRWMQTLYSYISAREREEIAEAPIQQAMRNYRETRGTLAVVYFSLVVALIYFGCVAAKQPPAASPSATPPAAAPPPVPPVAPPAPPAPPPPSPAPHPQGPAPVPAIPPAPAPTPVPAPPTAPATPQAPPAQTPP
jgi:hypothetical protein